MTTERLTLRWFTEDDAALMLAVWNDPDFVRHVGDRGIRTLDAARDALARGILAMYRDHRYGPYRVATKGGDEPMGICGLFRRDYLDDPDIGFGLLPEFCRQGYRSRRRSRFSTRRRRWDSIVLRQSSRRRTPLPSG